SPGQGSASVKMVTGSCPECPNFSILGQFGPVTPLPSPLGGGIDLTAPYTQRPLSVDFKYKSNPMGNDAAGFSVQLTRYNPVTDEDETIGEGYFEAGTQITNWTNMNIPIVYYSSLTPDAITFWATSSIGSIPDLTSLGMPYVFPVPAPVAGSEFYVDAIIINLPSCAGFSASVTGTNETSFGALDGTATATVSGGTAPYTYLWSNLSATASITGLIPSLYSVTVVDGNGCSKVGSYNVLPFSCGAFTVSVSGTNATSFTSEDGSASATVTGGAGPYTYLWNTGATTSSITGLRIGAYSVAVTDASGNCFAWGYFPTSTPTGIKDVYSKNDLITVYPNPSNGLFSLKSETKIFKVEIINTLGETVYQSGTGNQTSVIDLSGQPKGIYFVHINNEKGNTTEKLVLNN
ncbi:MAG: T9SS type A sorting domain-containing protein, partial [Bacteroidetes bacterium]|nr:T9SS type A sorting domain-containing protein [Bacteroidota bacterium]